MMQYGYCAPVRGYLSSSPAMVHFGLAGKPIDSIRVLWPDGKTELVQKPSINQMLVLDHKNAISAATQFGDMIKPSLLSQVDSSLQIDYLHKEDDYVDFKAQPILQHTCSHEGPGLAAGDINGDGLDDFFIGAAAGFDGAVLCSKKTASF
jgi:hypothetical protein